MIRCRCLAALRHAPWLALTLVVGAGCTRSFFRERADRDVEGLLTEKGDGAGVPVEAWHVYPDGRARFADAQDPDHPKKPPDDPATAALAPDPQPFRGKFCSGPDQEGDGYLEFLRHCDQHNRSLLARAAAEDGQPLAKLGVPQPYAAAAAATPGGLEALQQSLEGALRIGGQGYLINMDQALELSLFNSREFQNRREDLYLASLPVTLERFAFVTQFFAGVQAVREWNASDVPGGPGSAWDITSTGRASQLFPSGARLVTSLANRLVIDLTSGNPTVGLSNLTLELTQPLLRGGGWAVTLEPLTQVERNLVYAVRSWSRFRKNYYVYIAGGEDIGNGVFGYSRLVGFGAGLDSPGAPAQGYLPTLLAVAQERNEQLNLRNLNEFYTLYRQYQGRGDVSELQVGQVEQSILQGQGGLLTVRQSVQAALDNFKLQLGLPTALPLELDDSPTRPIQEMLTELEKARDEYQALRTEADQYHRALEVLPAVAGAWAGTVPVYLPARSLLTALVLDSSFARRAERFRASIPARWDRWRRMAEVELLAELTRQRRALRELRARQAEAEDRRGPALTGAEAADLDALPKDSALGQFELALRRYETAARLRAGTADEEETLYEDAVNAFIRVMGEARAERRGAIREAWPKLPGVTADGVNLLEGDLERAQTVAGQIALANRLELMSARAQMVDAWRAVAVEANSLLGVANVGYNFSTTSPPGENVPFALGGTRSRHQLILTGELPLVRRAERNSYRTALIAYQRSRRVLQATEDFILRDVRTELRNLRVLGENYRIQQRAVELAYDQVENSLDVLQAPPQPEGAGGAAQPGRSAPSAQQAANAAALTQQLLNQQTALLRAQNSLYQVWVNYLIARMTFYRDLERLPLDPRGVWIDEPCSPPGVQPDGVQPEVLPPPGPVEPADGGGFADQRAPGDR